MIFVLNKGEYNVDVKEYCLIWVVGEKVLVDGVIFVVVLMVYVKSDKLYFFYFYVIFNYVDNVGCVIVVVIQVIYIGVNILFELIIIEQMLSEVLDDFDF